MTHERKHEHQHERTTDLGETRKHAQQPVESGQARQEQGQNMSGHDHKQRAEETVTTGYPENETAPKRTEAADTTGWRTGDSDDEAIPLDAGVSDPMRKPDNPRMEAGNARRETEPGYQADKHDRGTINPGGA